MLVLATLTDTTEITAVHFKTNIGVEMNGSN
jgi:hypothetical protein